MSVSCAIPVIPVDTHLNGVTATEPARRWAAVNQFTGAVGQLLVQPDAQGGIDSVWVGTGHYGNWHSQSIGFFRSVGDRLPAGHFALTEAFASQEQAAMAWAGLQIGRYRFERYHSLPRPTVSFEVPNQHRQDIQRWVSADQLVRDLVNTPPEDMNPEQLTQSLKEMSTRHGGTFTEWVGEALLNDGFRLIHAVGRAAASEPRLIEARFGEKGPWVTLIGKGVCFDTGGLDMKTSAGMALMKKDMAGAAVVLGLVQMILAAQWPCRLQVIIPAVENAIGGAALRPSDVIRARNGITVEVTNTDAEGRLILADALSLVHPDSQLCIDCATLTGAARVALGPDIPVIMSEPSVLFEQLSGASQVLGERVWSLPLAQEYADDLKSPVAFLSNSASHTFAGAIMGGLFLQKFLPRALPWMHVDLYGWNPKDRPGFAKGGEAHALRPLWLWLEQWHQRHGRD